MKSFPIFLVLYAFLKEIKVGEPFLFMYQTKHLNLSAAQLTGDVYPYTAYSYMVAMVPIFVLTDLLLYKPTMLIEVLSQIGVGVLLVFGGSMLSQIFAQALCGVVTASEIAFHSYIYARSKKDQYNRLTTWARAGTMAGATVGGLFAQIFVLTNGNLYVLNIIALVFSCIVLLGCIVMPPLRWETMLDRMLEARVRPAVSDDSLSLQHRPKNYRGYVRYRMRKLGADLISIYRVGHILKWSFWCALTTCMSLQVGLFSQALWGEVQTVGEGGASATGMMNGFAEAAYTFVSVLAILSLNACKLNWNRWGELMLVLISTMDAVLLFVYAESWSIWAMYACYVTYRMLYQVAYTIAQWNIATLMVCESFGLAFGVNAFVATAMQSVMTFVVTDERGLGLSVRAQYKVYAAIHGVIAVIFFMSMIYTFISYLLGKERESPALLSRIESASESGLDSAIWNLPPPSI